MEITNQNLIDSLENHFKAELFKRSTKSAIIFPMSFTILLHPSDFQTLAPWFEFIITSIIKQLYDDIKRKSEGSFFERAKQKISKKGRTIEILAPSKEWFFKIVECDTCEINGYTIEKGNPFYLSAPCPLKITTRKNVDINPNINVSFSCQNSDPSSNYDINLESIKGVNELPGNEYRYKYNSSLSLGDLDNIYSTDKTYGTLSYKSLNFYIRDSLVSISGCEDKRRNNNIFKLDTSDLQEDHVQIKYEKSEDKFYISTVASDTRLNQRLLPQSIGGNIKWTLLPHNSEILMEGLYSVHFYKEK